VSSSSRMMDRVAVTFDEPNLVANAGLILVATLVGRLGLEKLINARLRMVGRTGGARPGRKVLSLVHAICAGASHIDHADVLRAGATESVLGHRVMAPSTLGTFLRAFTFGHVRQLDAVLGEAISRAWSKGAGPGIWQLVMDVDSTICEVAGKLKAGAGYGYTKVLGYHPIIATRADTGEVLHARLRRGKANTQRGAKRFVEELVARVRRAGAAGELVMRFDSGFWNNEVLATLKRLNVRFRSHLFGPRVRLEIHQLPRRRRGPGGRDHLQGQTPRGPTQQARRPRATAVARLASLRLLDRHRGRRGRGRCLSPCACCHRARHQGHERGRRTRAHALRSLLRQQCVALVRGSRPQPHALDGSAR
jgi:Transposase DDE domain group 1